MTVPPEKDSGIAGLGLRLPHNPAQTHGRCLLSSGLSGGAWKEHGHVFKGWACEMPRAVSSKSSHLKKDSTVPRPRRPKLCTTPCMWVKPFETAELSESSLGKPTAQLNYAGMYLVRHNENPALENIVSWPLSYRTATSHLSDPEICTALLGGASSWDGSPFPMICTRWLMRLGFMWPFVREYLRTFRPRKKKHLVE